MSNGTAQALANDVIRFVGKWLAVAVVAYFGWKLGGYIDGLVPF